MELGFNRARRRFVEMSFFLVVEWGAYSRTFWGRGCGVATGNIFLSVNKTMPTSLDEYFQQLF